MNDLHLTLLPVSKTGMLIRRPVRDVFNAFVDPNVTSQFWFTHGSGNLETGVAVQWEWEMYGISIPVTTKSVEQDKRIVIEWQGPSGPKLVEWNFTPHGDAATFVAIQESGFVGTGDELLRQVADSTKGFTLVLAGLKAFLEHNIRLNLVADCYPPKPE